MGGDDIDGVAFECASAGARKLGDAVANMTVDS